jgi:hypothetical protein
MRSILKTMLVVLLALLWVPIASHCALESAGWLPGFLGCAAECPADGTGSGNDGDACQSIEFAGYKPANDRLEIIVQVVPTVVADLVESLESLASIQEISRPSTVAAPEDPVTWQFTFRTALPPRAPSFAS